MARVHDHVTPAMRRQILRCPKERRADAAKGLTTIPLAVHEYERGLNAYAADAVRVSLKPITWQRRRNNPVSRRIRLHVDDFRTVHCAFLQKDSFCNG
ncbi:hypothetical protein [Kutzneria chonburiensis]|uniref:Transposase n=1 Tax=Kutzneria chonburiensis TaxID=1483604 RepID=A0ABV6MK55_9PSEU|nr:hypothetical protein [Kutzneria chonburiensis]